MNRMNWKLVKVSKDLVLRTIDNASETDWYNGLDWYREAHRFARFMSRKTKLPFKNVCGVIAALSPGTPWHRNILESTLMLEGKHGSFTTYPANVDKAARIINGENPDAVLGGNKVRNFYKLFVNPSDDYSVVIDRHAVRIAVDFNFSDERQASRFLVSNYERCADAYREAALDLGVFPNQAQAIAWETYRNLPKKERVWGNAQA